MRMMIFMPIEKVHIPVFVFNRFSEKRKKKKIGDLTVKHLIEFQVTYEFRPILDLT